MNNHGNSINIRSLYFDSLKGIAIIGIISVHSNAVKLSGLIGRIIATGARGVQLFFIISAYFIFRSLDVSNAIETREVIKWYIKRIIRLIPLYYLSLIVQFAVTEIGFVYGRGGGNVWTYLLHFLFLNGFSPALLNAININWYIGTLVVFILLAPVLFRYVNNMPHACLFFAFAYILRFASIEIMLRIKDESNWVFFWNTGGILAEMPVLSLGLILYCIKKEYDNPDKFLQLKDKEFPLLFDKRIVKYIMYLFCIALIYKCMETNASLIVYGFVLFITIIITSVFPTALVNNMFFSTIGRYSYGLYLFHIPILYYINPICDRYVVNVYLSQLIAIGSTLILCFGVSFVLTNLYERPIIRWMEYRLNIK